RRRTSAAAALPGCREPGRGWRAGSRRLLTGDLRRDVEALAAALAVLHHRRLERGVVEDLRLLEQVDQRRGRSGISRELHLAAGELPFREPGVVWQEARRLEQQLRDGGAVALAVDQEELVLAQRIDLLLQGGGGDGGFLGRLELLLQAFGSALHAVDRQIDRDDGERGRGGAQRINQGALMAALAGDRRARGEQVARAGERAAVIGDIDAVGVELEAPGDGEGLVDDRARHDDELDAQPLRRRVALDDAVGESGLVGAERRVPVELEGDHLLQIRFRRQRQVDDGAQRPLRAEAQADRRLAAAELARQPMLAQQR